MIVIARVGLTLRIQFRMLVLILSESVRVRSRPAVGLRMAYERLLEFKISLRCPTPLTFILSDAVYSRTLVGMFLLAAHLTVLQFLPLRYREFSGLPV